MEEVEVEYKIVDKPAKVVSFAPPEPSGQGKEPNGNDGSNGRKNSDVPEQPQVTEEIVISADGSGSNIQEVTQTPDGVTKVVNNIQEASSIKIPAWRGVGDMKGWFYELIDIIETAGGRVDHLERAWMLETLEKDKSVEYFAVTWRECNGDARHKERFIRMGRFHGSRRIVPRWIGMFVGIRKRPLRTTPRRCSDARLPEWL